MAKKKEQGIKSPNEVSARLREIRKGLGLTMDKVCEDMTMKKPQLSRDELGVNNLSVKRLLKYCEYYKVSLKIS